MKIDFFSERVPTPWSPSELDTFLGGTQSWEVELMEALKRRGHEIHFFNGGEYDCDCEVAVIWNHPNAQPKNLRAKKVIYWTNGADPWSSQFKDFYEKVHHIVAMSMYHAKELNDRFADKIVVIPGGVDPGEFYPADFDIIEDRVPSQMLYASSWDRGLKHILAAWPYLLKYNKEMTLHVTYGRGLAKKCGVDLPKLPDLPNLVVHEEVTRAKMVRLFFQSEFLLFASHEPSKMSHSIYLTALKAQYAECIPLTTPHVAVDPQIYGGIQVPLSRFNKSLVDLSLSNGQKMLCRSQLRSMKTPTWDDVAAQWETLFA